MSSWPTVSKLSNSLHGKDDADFHQLLLSYAAILPLRLPSRLRDPKVRQRLLAMTDGITVGI